MNVRNFFEIKKFALTCWLALFSSSMFAGQYDFLWSKPSSDETITVYAAGGAEAPDGGFYLVVNSTNFAHWPWTYGSELIKLDSSGNLDKNFGTGGVVDFSSITQEGLGWFVAPLVVGDKIFIGSEGRNRTKNINTHIIVSLEEDGSVNTQFGQQGIVKYEYNSADRPAVRGLVLTNEQTLMLVSFLNGDYPKKTLSITTYDLTGNILTEYSHFTDVVGYIKMPKVVSGEDGVWIGTTFQPDRDEKTWHGGLIKVKNSGNLDGNFGTNGVLTFPAKEIQAIADIHVDENRIIFLNRTPSGTHNVTEHDKSGGFIRSIVTDFTESLYPANIRVYKDFFYIAGNVWPAVETAPVYKFSMDGTLDEDFFNQGTAILPDHGCSYGHGEAYFKNANGDFFVFGDSCELKGLQTGVVFTRLRN